ncbi:DUF262 domain-containing protein [Saccharopolyspora sp. ASAGF58]|uniref:GmrSD restriction endonuclease domain-containing protein n=1 Tax=Saccharopolyspora sp. ASAGF58 TaxID=2719023 RepID=UPI001FF08E9D|nr:DUF262 domain-containing protein [Saccharopolyspora sp. ASAGF58]
MSSAWRIDGHLSLYVTGSVLSGVVRRSAWGHHGMTLFKNTTYSVDDLVGRVGKGEIALPDLQRPFVWDTSKVRDLFDSLYRGFPVGSLHLWEARAEQESRQIGTDAKQSGPRLFVVDGQQRITSLFAALTGVPVLSDDFEDVHIRIAFRPADGAFRVHDATVEKNPEFIPDIAAGWADGTYRVIDDFLTRLQEHRELDNIDRDKLANAIGQLHAIRNYTFHAVELSSAADPEEVSDIFVRINSKGTPLNQSDFILTLMSVFWDDGRRELEKFSQESRQPSIKANTSFNWHLQPKPPQLLRVIIAVAFRRAVLRAVYSLLRGHDMRGGKLDSADRQGQFARLQQAQAQVLDLSNWHEFLRCLDHAGFSSGRIISSQNTVMYSYALWLIGRIEYEVPVHQLRETIARWFFMAQITSRYTGSFESRAESDLSAIDALATKDAQSFLDRLNRTIDDTLTGDFWTITLPNELNTSASGSPALYSYLAALNVLEADVLLSTSKVSSHLNPSVLATRNVERHRLFPRDYLENALGVNSSKQYNQIANMTIVDWVDDIRISDRAPSAFWPEQLAAKNIGENQLQMQLRHHALPNGWEQMDFQEFLAERRSRMAKVIREAFFKIGETTYQPTYQPPTRSYLETPAESADKRSNEATDLFGSGVLADGVRLYSASGDKVVTVRSDGSFEFDGEVYSSLATLTVFAGSSLDGQDFWQLEADSGMVTLRWALIEHRRQQKKSA